MIICDVYYKSVYRVDILKYAKYDSPHTFGLCFAIKNAYVKVMNDMWYPKLIKLFPLFGTNVEAFGGDKVYCYWWPIGEWHTGREAYLDWLIEQYKDDKTDLKTLKL